MDPDLRSLTDGSLEIGHLLNKNITKLVPIMVFSKYPFLNATPLVIVEILTFLDFCRTTL